MSRRMAKRIHTHSGVGLKVDRELCGVGACGVMSAGKLVVDVFRDVERENEPWPTGCFPRAFSDILRDCKGTASSATLLDDALSGVVSEVLFANTPLSPSSSSSSSPIAKASFSGTLPSCGERAEAGLRVLSSEPLRPGLRIPEAGRAGSPRSLRSWACLSSSAIAPSTVKSRRALKRLRLRTTTSTKRRLARKHQVSTTETEPKREQTRLWNKGNKDARIQPKAGDSTEADEGHTFKLMLQYCIDSLQELFQEVMVGLLFQQKRWRGQRREEIQELGAGGALQVTDVRGNVVDDRELRWVYRLQAALCSRHESVEGLRHRQHRQRNRARQRLLWRRLTVIKKSA